MISSIDLPSQTRRELAELARNYGVMGWHSLRKDDLIAEIKKHQAKLRRQASAESKKNGSAEEVKAKTSTTKTGTPKTATPTIAKPISNAKRKRSTREPVADSQSDASKSVVTKQLAPPLVASKAVHSEPAQIPAVTEKGAGVVIAAVHEPSLVPAPKTNTSRNSGRIIPANRVKPAPVRQTPEPVDLTEPKISAKTARIRAEMRRRRELSQRRKDLSTATLVGGNAMTNGTNRQRGGNPHRDRVVLIVRESYWLQANWEVTRTSVQRAESALAERWHNAVPTLRLLTIGDESGNPSETVCRDIEIHGGVSNWYIDVQDPPSRFRVAIGYVTEKGDFHALCRSNVVETPIPGDCERLDEHWQDIAEDYERIYALSGGYEAASDDLREVFEERLQRNMPHRTDSGSMTGDPSLLRQSKLKLDVEAELIVFGKTDPTASVMVSGHPVKLQSDGAFTVRMEFPDKRQVLPITAETRDGLRQRTTVIAIERNTKVMDTVELQENV